MVRGLGGGQPPPTDEVAPDDTMARFVVGVVLVMDGAHEAEELFSQFMSRVAAVEAAMHELASWTPSLFAGEVEDLAAEDLVRAASRDEAREARWRAECLTAEAQAAEEDMAGILSELRRLADGTCRLRHQMSAAMGWVWRKKPAGMTELDEVTACDLLAAVVAGAAMAVADLLWKAGKELDRVHWQVYSGLRRLQQARRVECCSERRAALSTPAWLEWLAAEDVWWSVLAAAAEALGAESSLALAANTGGGCHGNCGGGGGGHGPAGGGDGKPPTVGSDSPSQNKNRGAADGGISGLDSAADGGGGDTPQRSRTHAGSWQGGGEQSWVRQGPTYGAEAEQGGDRQEELLGWGGRRSAGWGSQRLRQLGWRRWLTTHVGAWSSYPRRRRMRAGWGAGIRPVAQSQRGRFGVLAAPMLEGGWRKGEVREWREEMWSSLAFSLHTHMWLVGKFGLGCSVVCGLCGWVLRGVMAIYGLET